jgi:hypothetical protein
MEPFEGRLLSANIILGGAGVLDSLTIPKGALRDTTIIRPKTAI